MTEQLLRGIGAALNAGGAILLAIRVTLILKALGNVAALHEQNLEELTKGLTGQHPPGRPIIQAVGQTKWIEQAQRLWLLMFGFALIFAGAACQLAAAFL